MTFFEKVLKRIFDILFSLLGIILTFPVMVVAFIIASIDTNSFGVFRQKRVGKDANLFWVYKIKTMRPVTGEYSTITTKNDMRITVNGKFFRNTKIDELPQLFNVLFGSMSFVGPRPDVVGYADKLEGEDRIILSVLPGITGPASLKYKNEEEILAEQSNAQEFNDEVIWPDKVKINREYIENWSFQKDIKYIFQTLTQKELWVEFFFQESSKKRIVYFLIFDFLISVFTILLSYLLRFNYSIDTELYSSIVSIIILLIPLKIAMFLIFKVYHVAWRFFGLTEYKQLVLSHFAAYIIFTIIYLIFRDTTSPFPRSVIVIDLFLSIFFIAFFRISKRLYLENKIISRDTKLLLVGANAQSTNIIKNAFRGEIDYYPVALVSDNKRIIGTYFSKVPVYSKSSVEKIVDQFNINSVIITEQLSQKELDDLFTKLNNLGIKDIKIAHLFQDKKPALSDISVDDLLARHPKDLDFEIIEKFIKGKKVLITGAGGSIGSEIVKQCSAFGANSLMLIDHNEFGLYSVGENIENAKLKLLNITNHPLLDEIFKEFKPDIVIHAAAYKHVPTCEENQVMAVENNVLGSKNVIDISITYEVKKVIIISTDKAAYPTSVMAATKRVGELYAENVKSARTEITSVRFGNVLGSRGSVMPKFKQQITEGKSVTVSHPEITRYFMRIDEACQLVLQTAAIAKGGELFILDMGEPIKIVDLAKQMIRLYGKEDEINIEFTGLRAGEKLYEELLLDESEQKTKYSSIFIAKPTPYDITQLNHDIDVLLTAKDKVRALQKIVLEFTREDLI